jgi:hypothetical protein
VCSSAIRWRGPRQTELPKLHSARPPAVGRPPTPAEGTSPRSYPRGSVAWESFAEGGVPRSRRAAPCGAARGVFQRHSVALTRESPFLPVKRVDNR